MPVAGTTSRQVHPAALTVGALVVALLATAAVVWLPFLRFAYRAPALHVSLETANAVIAVLVAYLVYGRFRESRRLQDLLLVLALCTVAVANFLLTALPSAVTIGRDEDFSRWAAVMIRLIGTAVLTVAAFAPRRWRVDGSQTVTGVGSVAVVVLVVSVAGLAYGGELPPTVDPSLHLGDGTRPRLVAHPVVLGVQALGALLYALAAVAFTRKAARHGDGLLRWVGAGCVLASVARVHYLLFPSLYSEYVYTGDLLRSGFYLMLLVGAAREIRSYWETRARAAVLEDRRRMARDLHDGLTQELAYICAQAQRLGGRPGDVALAERIGAAAGRAVDEARRAITALTNRDEEPFPVVLHRAADDMAHRYDVKVVSEVDPAADVDATHQEDLLRIMAEAVRNAVRHGRASRIELRLSSDPLCMAVIDDGTGFDVDAPGRPGGFGVTSMRERAAALGAELGISSSPGEGTTVRVTWS